LYPKQRPQSKVEDKVHWFPDSSNEAGYINNQGLNAILYSSVAGFDPTQAHKDGNFRISKSALTP